MVFRALMIVAALALAPGPAAAWDVVGHRIAAAIAERLLTPDALPQVRELLVADGAATLADVSNWADSVRPARPDTAGWHFVAIPLAATSYDPARDCPGGNCLVARIEQLRLLLADKKAEPKLKVEALKWLVHLIADLHQPLRCIDNGDRNGSEFKIRFFGRPTNLLRIWDSSILERLGRPDRIEARLVEAVTRDDARLWSEGSAADWAMETHDLARRVAYEPLGRDQIDVGQAYMTPAGEAVEHQLLRAGVRIAAVINIALRRDSKPWWQLWSGPEHKPESR
jgi:hypothetical protein